MESWKIHRANEVVQCNQCIERELIEEATYTDSLGWFCIECWAELTEEEQEELI